MKKITIFILGIFLLYTASLFAGDVQKIDPNAWLDHTSKMQVLRENIMALVSKKMPTQSDKDELSSLRTSFEAEQNRWQNYLKQVANSKDVKYNAYPNKENCAQYNCGKSNLCNAKMCMPGCKCPKCASNKMSAKSMKCANCDGNCNAKMCMPGCKCPKCMKN